MQYIWLVFNALPRSPRLGNVTGLAVNLKHEIVFTKEDNPFPLSSRHPKIPGLCIDPDSTDVHLGSQRPHTIESTLWEAK
jgi:hypothetical protein